MSLVDTETGEVVDSDDADEVADGFLRIMLGAAAEQPDDPPSPLCDAPTDTEPKRGPKGWTAIRAVVLHRDGYRCYRCRGAATEVDHLWPKSRGGSDKLSNLAAICRACNAKKGDTLYIQHITADRCGDAHTHYVLKAVDAALQAARWIELLDLLHERDERLTVDEMTGLVPSKATSEALAEVLRLVAKVAEKSAS